MRKELLGTLIGTALAMLSVFAYADDPQLILWTSVTCETNAAATVTNNPDTDQIYSGWVEAVILDYSGAANTGKVSIVTSGDSESGTGFSRSILVDASVTTDEAYSPRIIVDTTAGADIASTTAKIPLLGNRIDLTAFGFTSTNTTLKAYLLISSVSTP